MPIEPIYVKGVLDEPFALFKTQTQHGIDIIHSDRGYNNLYDLLHITGNVNIIDFQSTSEFNMAAYTRAALNQLPKKDHIVVGYLSEALNSTYWNVVFDIIGSYGYKKIIWVDGGLTPGYLYNHLNALPIFHKTGTMFFQVLNNNHTAGYPTETGPLLKRTYYYLSLGRLARKERIYFTKKILEDKIKEKGIYSCGWGDESVQTTWNKDNSYDRENLLMLLDEKDIEKFPISLGHADGQQHHMVGNFNEAVFNVVQESSVGFDQRSHELSYNRNYAWCRVNSDRQFFTEKSAKPFLMSQMPLFIAAPGYVNQLRILGFDVFDDILDHSYDREDYIFKRCDMVFDELKRLTNLYTLDGWNAIMRERLTHRFHRNFMLMKELSNDNELAKWINSKLV
jgi:hypothetical protein